MVKVNDHSLQHLIYTLVITYIYSNETYPLSVFVHYLLKNVNYMTALWCTNLLYFYVRSMVYLLYYMVELDGFFLAYSLYYQLLELIRLMYIAFVDGYNSLLVSWGV